MNPAGDKDHNITLCNDMLQQFYLKNRYCQIFYVYQPQVLKCGTIPDFRVYNVVRNMV